ncbi:fimbrillin family protein [Parabacteroides goldsteinii]|uniref:fimbrillin family protein n=1 Tax=Parabacteroides goldsteinii TaxID=328812 RepID=UPI0032B2F33E
MRNLLLLITLISGLAGCSHESNFSAIESISAKEKPLKIITRILTTKSAYFVQEFKEGSEIGLLITRESDGGLYDEDSDYINVKAEANLISNKISWRQTPEVTLNFDPATVYAYYPYQSQMKLGTASIPVKLSPDATQTRDYMYGTHALGQKIVNSISPVVLLNMEHALSLISFQVNLPEGENESYQLSAIQIGNKAGGSALICKGMMDIRNGRITKIAGCSTSTRLNLPEPVTLGKEYCKTQQIRVIPTTAPIAEGDIEALFTINGNSYKYKMPAQTMWEKGHKYLYKLTLSGEALTLKEVSVTDWIQGNGEDATSSIM